jgi:hypothetical protein
MRRIALPPMLGGLVQATLPAMEGVTFTDLPACPECSGPVKRHDRKEKRFARMLMDGQVTDIHILVDRFRCRSCGGFWYAREPFYEGVRFGIPVVDLAITLSRIHPYHRTEKILAALGLVVDRGTIRLYALRAQREVPATNTFGMPLPLSLFALSNLVSRRPKGSPVTGAEVLAALGLPPAHRAPEHPPPPPPYEGDEGNDEDEEERRDPGEVQEHGEAEGGREEGAGQCPAPRKATSFTA